MTLNVFSPNLPSFCTVVFVLMVVAAAVPTLAGGHGDPLTFSGTVVDLDGRPASGINVHLAPVMDNHEGYELRLVRGLWADPVASVQTDSKGRWALDATQGRLWRLLVEHPGRATMTRRVEPLWGDREMSVVTLRPAISLEVLVRGPGGGAVAGAQVVGFGHASTVDEWPFSYAAATTDEAGIARLRLPAEGPCSFEVVAKGLAPTQVKGASSRAVNVTLARGSRLDLRLRLPNGKPAAGALAYRWRSGITLAKADHQGRLSLFGEPGSRQRFGFLSADRSLLDTELEFPAAGQLPAHHTLELSPPLLLALQAVTAGSLEPVADAVAWSIDDHTAFSDDRGHLELAVLPTKEPVLLRLSAPHHVLSKQSLDPDVLASGLTTTVVMEPAASLFGKVTDPSGRPLSQVVLEVWGERDLQESRLGRHTDGQSGRSNARGGFGLPRLPIGQRLRLLASKPGYGTAFRDLDPLVAGGQLRELALVLEPGHSAVGTVLDETGEAIAGARVEVSRSLETSGRERVGQRRVAAVSDTSAVSDDEGRFDLRDLEKGRFDLVVSAAGFVKAEVHGVEIAGTEGPARLDVLRLRRSTQIAGRVVDDAGSPLAGASIALTTLSAGSTWKPAVTSGPDGRFVFIDLAPGAYDLKAEADGFMKMSSGRVDPPLAEPLQLQLSPGQKLTGNVLDEHGAPVAGAAVRSDERSPGSSSVRTASDTIGGFELAGLSPGEHRVRIQARGFKTQRHTVFVRPGAPPSVLEVALERSATVIGSVSWPDGRPVPSAAVRVQLAAGGRRGNTNGSGQFEIDEVSMGAAEVVASFGALQARKEIEVGPGSNRVSLTLPSGVEVSGWILDQEGRPVPAADVSLGSYKIDSGAISGGDGSFTLGDVPPGNHRLKVRHPRFAAYAAKTGIEVGAEPVAGVEVYLLRGAVVLGCLDPATLEAMRLATPGVGTGEGLRVELSGRRSYSSPVDSAGCFRFERVLSGSFKAKASRRWQVVAAGNFELPEDLSELEIELEPVAGIELQGRVLRDGEGVSGATVEVYHDFTTMTHTRADGSFVLHPVPEGEWNLEVRSATGVSHRQRVDVRKGREVIIEIATGEISGQVRDAETGDGLAGAQVNLVLLGSEAGHAALWQRKPDEKITTDSMGAYLIAGLARGSYQLRVEHKGYITNLTELEVGPTPISDFDLALKPAEALVLRVIQAARTELEWAAADSVGLGFIEVEIFDLEGNLLLSLDSMDLDEDGRLSLDGIPAGTWELWVMTWSSAWTRLRVDHPGEETAVTLRPGATVAFAIPESVDHPEDLDYRFTAPDGQPLPRQLSRPFVLSDHDGQEAPRAHLENFWSGHWTLEVRHPDGRAWTAAFTAAAGGHHELELSDYVPGTQPTPAGVGPP